LVRSKGGVHAWRIFLLKEERVSEFFERADTEIDWPNSFWDMTKCLKHLFFCKGTFTICNLSCTICFLTYDNSWSPVQLDFGEIWNATTLHMLIIRLHTPEYESYTTNRCMGSTGNSIWVGVTTIYFCGKK
jgi:hypothetical protein